MQSQGNDPKPSLQTAQKQLQHGGCGTHTRSGCSDVIVSVWRTQPDGTIRGTHAGGCHRTARVAVRRRKFRDEIKGIRAPRGFFDITSRVGVVFKTVGDVDALVRTISRDALILTISVSRAFMAQLRCGGSYLDHPPALPRHRRFRPSRPSWIGTSKGFFGKSKEADV